mmetsp:Transcript_7973/g.27894  ORF Transcript_7973/g.27894 Transcript_7973/m.27894 type:complete len:280 (+) Transcript_7973:1148-1987(+)
MLAFLDLRSFQEAVLSPGRLCSGRLCGFEGGRSRRGDGLAVVCRPEHKARIRSRDDRRGADDAVVEHEPHLHHLRHEERAGHRAAHGHSAAVGCVDDGDGLVAARVESVAGGAKAADALRPEGLFQLRLHQAVAINERARFARRHRRRPSQAQRVRHVQHRHGEALGAKILGVGDVARCDAAHGFDIGLGLAHGEARGVGGLCELGALAHEHARAAESGDRRERKAERQPTGKLHRPGGQLPPRLGDAPPQLLHSSLHGRKLKAKTTCTLATSIEDRGE